MRCVEVGGNIFPSVLVSHGASISAGSISCLMELPNTEPLSLPVVIP